MYIWSAINVNDQLLSLREKVKQISDRISSSNSALTLPLHVSLRISFEVDDSIFEEVADRIERYYSTISPFAIEIQSAERNGNIVWLRMVENGELSRIHKDLLDILLSEYGVKPHELDKAYIYHTTLFTDSDVRKADEFYSDLQGEIYPNKLTASKLLIGCSETGHAGEYRVIKTVNL